MGLIVFIHIFVAMLLISTVYFSTQKEVYAKQLLKISLSSFFGTLFFASTIVTLYFFPEVSVSVFSKIFLIFIIFTSFLMLEFAIKFPYFKKHIAASFFNFVLHIAGVFLVIFYIRGLTWNALSSFKMDSNEIMGLNTGRIIYLAYLLTTSAITALIFFFKSFVLSNSIFKQQSALLAVSFVFFIFLWISIYELTYLFSWTIAITPLGYILFIIFTFRICSINMLFDKKQIFLGFLRFFLFIFIFALLAGFASAFILTNIRSLNLQVILLAVFAAVFLLFSKGISTKLKWVLGDTREYRKPLFEALQKIDYTAGREETAERFSRIITEHMSCSGLNIFVSSDNNIFEPIYSTVKNTATFDTKKTSFDFILNENISILTKNEILSNHKYNFVRSELSDFFRETGTEIAVFVREGQKLIGCIGLANKSYKADYTSYDIEVLQEMYSYFFLIVYYLRNIAKEDIVITVDREIEMSGQIIGSVQKNMDLIKGRAIEVESVSYSAYQLGGDFIDFIRLSKDKYFFVIGDIAGKGLSASMSMVILKSVLKTFLIETQDFKNLVAKVNVFVKENLPRGTFFAGLFGILDLKANTIYYLNCGIPLMAMYVDSYKNVIEIQGEGKVLGFVKDISPFLKVRKITMNSNDAIVFTTDGLIESTNLKGDRFGNERVSRLLSVLKDKKALEIAQSIYKTLSGFIAGGVEDDITILVFKHRS